LATPSKAKPKAAPTGVVSLERLGVTRLSFLETGAPLPVDQRQRPDEITFAAGAGFRLGSDRAEVKVEFKITPNQDVTPYAIEIEMIGEFTIKDGSKDLLDAFARNNAPAIMMPYVRQVVHSITAAARYGAVTLPLLNTQALFRDENWSVAEAPSSGTKTDSP